MLLLNTYRPQTHFSCCPLFTGFTISSSFEVFWAHKRPKPKLVYSFGTFHTVTCNIKAPWPRFTTKIQHHLIFYHIRHTHMHTLRNTKTKSHNKLPPLPPSCLSFDFPQWFHFKFPGVHFPPALILSAAITIHLGPLAFCLTAQSLHISLNILQYSNTAHIKSSELPFIYQTSASSHLAEKKPSPAAILCYWH